MANTLVIDIPGGLVWTAITVSSGRVNVSDPCYYCKSSTTPDANVFGHRLDDSDYLDFKMMEGETLYLKSEDLVRATITQTGFGAPDERVFSSTVQESVREGKQQVASAILTVPAGQAVNIGFRTGNKPVTINSRTINQIGSSRVEYSAREKLSFTGNIEANRITPKNPNNRNRVLSSVNIWHSVTPGIPTSETYQYLDPYALFSAGQNTSTRVGSDTLGLDYPLNANTDHVFTINNTGTGSATVFWWITFSEG